MTNTAKSFDASKFVKSPYLKAADLDRRRPVRVTVSTVEVKEFEEGEKPLLKFLEIEEGLILNKTQIRTMIDNFGSDTAGWVGQRILLKQVTSAYQGKPTIEIAPAEIVAPGSKLMELQTEEAQGADLPF